MTDSSPLTAKQQRFVEEYIVDLNATQAAIRAGYSAKTAEQIGYQQLQHPSVSAAIAQAQLERSKRTEITQDRVLEELALIAFSDMRQFAEWGPRGVHLLDSATIAPEAARCVGEVRETVTQHGGSKGFKLHDKVAALEKLGRHLGMFNEKEVNVGGLTIRVVRE